MHTLDRGIDIRYIKELPGHFSIKTTERYFHVRKEQLINIASPLDDIKKSGGLEWQLYCRTKQFGKANSKVLIING